MKSIRRWFLGWLIFGFVAASGIAAFGIFHTAREEASELFDYELRAVALSLPRSVAPGNDALASEDRIVIDIWDDSNRLVYSSQHALPGERMQEGFRTIERDEKHWRVFGSRQPDRFVQVAQPVSVRDALALRAGSSRSAACRGRSRRARSTHSSRCGPMFPWKSSRSCRRSTTCSRA
jgi:two-component system OmpR family sensor kinase